MQVDPQDFFLKKAIVQGGSSLDPDSNNLRGDSMAFMRLLVT